MTTWTVSGWLAFCAASAVAGLAVVRMREQAARVARASHEVRGGLAVVWLALGRGGAGPPETIAAQLARARRALDDLDAAAAAPDELVDLAALARSVAQGFPRVTVTAFGPAWVRGDAAALGQAASNLVANAVEHGAPPVRVRAESAAGTVRVEVTDAGPGLTGPLAELVRRARGSRSRRGHGLAIAADVAERHGGRLATAPAEAGSRLVLTLPAAAAPEPRTAPAPPPAAVRHRGQ